MRIGLRNNGVRDVHDSRQSRAASGKHHSRGADFEHSRMAQVFAQHLEKFASARLENFADHALRNQARRPISDRWHFDFVAFRDQRDDGVAESFLIFSASMIGVHRPTERSLVK